ncbi:MAG: hypothetical protein AB8B69_10690 [Chitinophagales bacterium]
MSGSKEFTGINDSEEWLMGCIADSKETINSEGFKSLAIDG